VNALPAACRLRIGHDAWYSGISLHTNSTSSSRSFLALLSAYIHTYLKICQPAGSVLHLYSKVFLIFFFLRVYFVSEHTPVAKLDVLTTICSFTCHQTNHAWPLSGALSQRQCPVFVPRQRSTTLPKAFINTITIKANTRRRTACNRPRAFHFLIAFTSSHTFNDVQTIHTCVALRRGYDLRNASLGDFFVVQTFTNTNLDSIAYNTPRLYGIAYWS